MSMGIDGWSLEIPPKKVFIGNIYAFGDQNNQGVKYDSIEKFTNDDGWVLMPQRMCDADAYFGWANVE